MAVDQISTSINDNTISGLGLEDENGGGSVTRIGLFVGPNGVSGTGTYFDNKILANFSSYTTYVGIEVQHVDGTSVSLPRITGTKIGSSDGVLAVSTELADLINNDAAYQAAGIQATLSGIEVHLNMPGGPSLNTRTKAGNALTSIDTARQTLNSRRASLGALSNRLDHIIANNTNIATNIAKSISRIEDADFAAETTNLAKQQILQQASIAMLAQANASKQNILTLLQG